MAARKKISQQEVEERLARLEEELSALKAAYMGVALDEARRPAGAFQILTFVVGGAFYGIPLWAVAGVSWAVAATEEQRLSAPYIGLVNFHGDLVPLIDGALAFGGSRRLTSPQDQIIYVAAGGRRVGLLASAALDVETLDGVQITMAGEASLDRKLYFGVAERRGEMVRILEPIGVATGVAFGAALEDFGERPF